MINYSALTDRELLVHVLSENISDLPVSVIEMINRWEKDILTQDNLLKRLESDLFDRGDPCDDRCF